MRSSINKPNFRTVIDLGLRPIDERNEPRSIATDTLRSLGAAVVVLFAVMIVMVVVVLTLGPIPAALTSLVLWVTAVIWLINRQKTYSSSVVVRVQRDGTNQAARMIIVLPLLMGLLALLARSWILGILALAILPIVILAWRRREMLPAAIRHVHARLQRDESVIGDGVGVDSDRKWRNDGARVLAITDRRVIVGSVNKNGENQIEQLAPASISSYEFNWYYLGGLGSLTLHLRQPIGYNDPRTTIKFIRIAPHSVASLVSALQSHGVAGPSVDVPGQRTKTDRDSRGRPKPLRKKIWRGFQIFFLAWFLFGFLFFVAVKALELAGVDLSPVISRIEEKTGDRLPVDGKSNLTGGNASISYSTSSGLIELRTDEDWGEGPNDGARWELRSKAGGGYNFVSLSNYVFQPLLDNKTAVDRWVASKDAEHDELAGNNVDHSTITVDGRVGYVWEHSGKHDYWFYAAWFPAATGTVRLECKAKKQREKFEALCAEALDSLKFAEPTRL